MNRLKTLVLDVLAVPGVWLRSRCRGFLGHQLRSHTCSWKGCEWKMVCDRCGDVTR